MQLLLNHANTCDSINYSICAKNEDKQRNQQHRTNIMILANLGRSDVFSLGNKTILLWMNRSGRSRARHKKSKTLSSIVITQTSITLPHHDNQSSSRSLPSHPLIVSWHAPPSNVGNLRSNFCFSSYQLL